MDKNKTLAIVAVVAVAAISLSGNQKPHDPKVKSVEPVKAARLQDGGLVYYSIDKTDAGTQPRIVAIAPYARKNPKIGQRCWRLTEDAGMVDFGDYNRFPRQLAVGPDCQFVAESVYMGQDPDKEE